MEESDKQMGYWLDPYNLPDKLMYILEGFLSILKEGINWCYNETYKFPSLVDHKYNMRVRVELRSISLHIYLTRHSQKTFSLNIWQLFYQWNNHESLSFISWWQLSFGDKFLASMWYQ